MAHSYHHAVSSARRFGGDPEDYQELHSFMDSTKATWADQRHRAVLHNSFGIFLTEEIFGLRKEVDLLRTALQRVPRWLRRLLRLEIPVGTPITLTLRSGKEVPIRFVAEQHVIEDCGFIPTLENYLGTMPKAPWMYRGASRLSRILEANQSLPPLEDPGVPESSTPEAVAPEYYAPEGSEGLAQNL